MSVELECLAALRASKDTFFRDIISHADNHAKQHNITRRQKAKNNSLDVLLSDEVYQIACLYFLVEECGLADSDRLRMWIDRHNADMESLITDRRKRDQHGLDLERVRFAIFSPELRENVAMNVVNGRVRFSQSDIARLLATLVAPEMCRRALVALEEGGLLIRVKTTSVLILSTGQLEQYFRKHLRLVIDTMAGALQGGPQACAAEMATAL